MPDQFNDHLVIPDAAVPYILFQRTAYLRFPVAPVYRVLHRALPFDTPLYNVVVAVESRLRRQQVKALYAADIRREYESLRAVLPSHCRALLDIGAGMAGIDVFLSRHYDSAPHVWLLDQTRVERNIFYLFRSQAAFYNSLDVAGTLLRQNNVPADRIHLLPAIAGTIPVAQSLDLVVSLLAWGFHFPVATYADRVRMLLRADGVGVLDIRTGTDGLDQLRRRFDRVEPLFETPKFQRVVFRP
jgi:hypothetical protein